MFFEKAVLEIQEINIVDVVRTSGEEDVLCPGFIPEYN